MTMIDKETLLQRINTQFWSEIENIIISAPSIDIVRCKECKHGTYCEEAEMYICNANDQDLYEAEHFCSYGEREGE